MEQKELMGSLKVSKAVAKMAIPSVISSLVTVVYNMADTFFVGQTNDPLQVAAVSLTNPIFILFMAFANMFGMGGSAVASIAMGEKKEERAKNASAFVAYASFFVGIVFAASLLLFMCPLLGRMHRPMRLRGVIRFIFLMARRLSSGRRRQALLSARMARAGRQ